ncbi:16S rRNA (guanine(527)-N(7))-methyltransferase RsmG [Rothia sp. AR01]|uniref:Ribosomal RNA small subunit methyltransferase G n=1 Tax=Rothia santali TaxID=2949643 RepID=A0A9X2HGY2_9MICC|nr:16S rRNA (guanine(527)-N(7))-methyltransferase RsmG [Rothia santali]MCP3425521.1 16S rRNA (guanine(527)-N(7))-methyltransferase RsmG [Rothia santali]
MSAREHRAGADARQAADADVAASPGVDGHDAAPAAPELSDGELRAAEEVFGDRLDLARRYVEHLATSGIERGLIGPREVPRLWTRHVLNCAVVQELIPQGARLADVGSGAGLPGLCLAIARPDLDITLIEPLERRVIWLDEVIEDLGLDNVGILRSRGEQAVGQIDVDVVTARAVSALVGLVDITLPLLRGTGQLLALKGRTAEEEIQKAQKKLDRYGVREAAILQAGQELLEEPTTVVRVVL